MAHRTSPTNMGLYLLSTLAARDMGWLGAQELADRLEATLQTLSQLELYRGHFYNWYDTQRLVPLDPKYVSSVDSGNLAANFLVLGNGCREIIQEPFLVSRPFSGVGDAIHLLREALEGMADTQRTHTVTRKQLANALDSLAALLDPVPAGAREWAARFLDIRERAQTVADIAQALAQELGETADSEIRIWAEAVRAGLESHARDARIMIPWLRLEPSEVMAMAERPQEQAPEWVAIEPSFRHLPALADVPDRCESAVRELASLRERLAMDPATNRDLLQRMDALTQALNDSAREASALTRRLVAIAHSSQSMFDAMDFTFLFDNSRKLFSIGFRGADGALDDNCYDLLASEARLTSFIAIAKGDVPAAHWFRSGSCAHSRRPRLRFNLLVRLDVRIPDAGAGDAFSREQHAEPDLRAGRGAPDRIRRRARRSLGHIRIGVQRARFGFHISVLGVRSAGPRTRNAVSAKTW